MTEPAPSILIARPRTILKAMTARPTAADMNRLTVAEVTTISSVKVPGGKDQKNRHGGLTAGYLYIVKMELEAKRNLYSVKITCSSSFRACAKWRIPE